jgi:hypothetical protein
MLFCTSVPNRSELTAQGSRYTAEERTWTGSKHTVYHVIAIHPVSWGVDRIHRKHSFSIVACSTVFTELLPGNALIKSVTIY